MLQLNRFDEDIATNFNLFINPELQEVMRERNRSKRQFNKSRKPEDWEKYRQLRNRAVSMTRKRVRDHFSRI